MIKDKDIYKLIDKKNINGKIRNIYTKNNNLQEYYIKSNGKYIINHFIFNKKNYTIYKIKNISDYKNKIAQQENKEAQKEYKTDLNTIKKLLSDSSVVYLYKPKNKSLNNAKMIFKNKIGGVGRFNNDVKIDNDDVLHRGFDYPLSLKELNNQTKKLAYNPMYDDIINEISDIGYTTNLFELINNLKYTINVNGIEFHIRPSIEFNNKKKFIIFFYINTNDFNDRNNNLRYIKMPLHVSLFLKDMLKKDNDVPKNTPISDIRIMCVTTGHIHITSDDNIKKFNITPIGLKHTELVPHTGKLKDISTHTYLIASSMQDIIDIMLTHGLNIFKDWKYTQIDSSDMKVFNLYYPDKASANWKLCAPNRSEPSEIILSSQQKKNIFVCFKNLYKIIHNIFYNLVYTISKNTSWDINFIRANLMNGFNVELLDISSPYYLSYTIQAKNRNKNIEYNDSLNQTRRDYQIIEEDIKEAEKYSYKCPGQNFTLRLPSPPRRRTPPSPRRRTPPSPRRRTPPSPRRRTPPSPRRRTPPPPRRRTPPPLRRRTPSPPRRRTPPSPRRRTPPPLRRRTPPSPRRRTPPPLRRRTPPSPRRRTPPPVNRVYLPHYRSPQRSRATFSHYRSLSPRSRTPTRYRAYPLDRS
jgi:hypothetical protein